MKTLTTKQAAELLQTSDDTIVRLIQDGELKAERLRPRSPYRISEQSLSEYAQRHSITLKLPPQSDK